MKTERSVEQISITLKVREAQRIAYERAAHSCGGMSRQAWAKLMLDAAAGVSDVSAQLRAVERAAKTAKKKGA